MNETIPITSRLVLAEAIDKKASFNGTVSGVTTLPTGASKLDIDIGNDTIPVVVSGHQSADLIHEQVAGIGIVRANKSGHVALVASDWSLKQQQPLAVKSEPLPPKQESPIVAMLKVDDIEARLNRLESVYEKCRCRAMALGVKDVESVTLVLLQLVEGK
jgi:hypothetical protein